MKINELKEGKCYRTEDLFYVYIFLFKKYERVYSGAYIDCIKLCRMDKVGRSVLLSIDTYGFSIHSNSEFTSVPDTIADKLFKVMKLSMHTMKTLLNENK